MEHLHYLMWPNSEILTYTVDMGCSIEDKKVWIKLVFYPLQLKYRPTYTLVLTFFGPDFVNFQVEASCCTCVRNYCFEATVQYNVYNSLEWRECLCFSDGKALVHSLQVQYIHQVIQSRLVDNPQPLTEVYNCLHFFCQSLQLEVRFNSKRKLGISLLNWLAWCQKWVF
jgi:hypothetical protein